MLASPTSPNLLCIEYVVNGEFLDADLQELGRGEGTLLRSGLQRVRRRPMRVSLVGAARQDVRRDAGKVRLRSQCPVIAMSAR
jgi:hypothetical protein